MRDRTPRLSRRRPNRVEPLHLRIERGPQRLRLVPRHQPHRALKRPVPQDHAHLIAPRRHVGRPQRLDHLPHPPPRRRPLGRLRQCRFINAFARKTTGSYYTPDELVQLILRRAVGPLLAERRAAFSEHAEKLAADTRRKPERLAGLARHDAAQAFLALRIVDPAMGSGHFLVSLVDYLTNATLEAIAEAPQTALALGEYRSPVMQRVEAIRAHIKAQAAENGWPVRDDQLDDQHIIRRIILKRCVYGVDLNPMAVELAKLSLWLHSFTVGAPLSFLDHHLRCGDSLFGEFAGPVERKIREDYGPIGMSGAIVSARQAATGMAMVEEETDADIAGVQASASGFAAVEQDTAPLRAFLDLYHAQRWLADQGGEAAREGRDMLFGGSYGNPVAIAAGTALRAPKADAVIKRKGKKPPIAVADAHAAAVRFVENARALAAERRFLHWEAAFPGVWDEWERQPPLGGFDAAIGNPPWDRMKMQEVEWFAARVPEIARSARASDRKAAVQRLRRASDPIAAEYDHAAWVAEAAIRVARECGGYPLLSGGDVNIYALMVERAARIVKPGGIVGLLVPSGIAADLGAAPFFRSISTSGRLAALLDFENRRMSLKLQPFFPDVDSRFKFCTLVFGGADRVFDSAECSFFNESAVAAEQLAFPLAPADFDAVNPNTGTAPIFRTPRDAEITKAIYARLPVLVDRRGPTPQYVWPVRYCTMFHMTNDSGKFRTEAELRKLGAYQLASGGWEKGAERWLPLYEGKMVQAFDHRAASVVVNSDNVHRPAQPQPIGDQLHADAKYLPKPQFWVSKSDMFPPLSSSGVLAFKDVTAPSNVRTMIAAIVPTVGCGNTLPILLPDSVAMGNGLLPKDSRSYSEWAILLLANLNAIPRCLFTLMTLPDAVWGVGKVVLESAELGSKAISAGVATQKAAAGVARNTRAATSAADAMAASEKSALAARYAKVGESAQKRAHAARLKPATFMGANAAGRLTIPPGLLLLLKEKDDGEEARARMAAKMKNYVFHVSAMHRA